MEGVDATVMGHDGGYWPWASLTSVCPVVVLHGWQVEEGVVAGGPGALIWFLPTVQFHVVVQGPFFTEGAITQVTFKLPGGEEERQWGIRRGEKPRVIYWSQSQRKMLDCLRRERENGGCWVAACTRKSTRLYHSLLYVYPQHTQSTAGC